MTPNGRQRIGKLALQLSRKDDTNNERGRRFESLLVFLLGQIADFEVVERNWHTETEELDAVIQQRSVGGRVWAIHGAPLILLEAKNWKYKVTQKELSTFWAKMKGKRGTVRLGFMVGASGFTSDARDQELRYSLDELTVVLVDPDQLEEWVAAQDVDAFLERIVRRAMLR